MPFAASTAGPLVAENCAGAAIIPGVKKKHQQQPEAFVALDLETTGLDARRDEIIELGAARVENGEVVDTFSRLARPSRPLPRAVALLTGITDRELQAAPPLADVLPEFLEFLGDDPLVAHNSPFDAGFLSAATSGRFRRDVLDSLELARIVLPEAPSHALDKLAARLGLKRGRAHRACDDAELAARLWLVLLEKLGALPLPVLTEINWLVGPLAHPMGKLLAAAEKAAVQAQLSGNEPEYEALLKARPSAARARPPEEDAELPPPPALDAALLAGELDSGGALSASLSGFEIRPEQLRMCRAVSGAFNSGRHLAVEAGTGVGKSFAYLLPAAQWAASGRRVVVSTNTKNLQSQLFGKDLPLLEKALGRPVEAALLKGRRNYLCLRKLLYVLREAASELDDVERAAILPVLVWAARTESGDLAECSPMHLPDARDLVDKLTTEGPDCLGRGCKLRGACFLWSARARAAAAKIVVANHALVLSDLDSETPVLPPHQEMVFDEAHNLEAAATDALSVRLNIGRFYRAFNRLFKSRGSGRRSRRRRQGGEEPAGTGLLPSIFEQCSRARGLVAVGFLERLEKDAGAASERLLDAGDAVSTFFATLKGLWTSQARPDKLRYNAADRRADLWSAPVEAKGVLVSRLAAVRERLERLAECLAEDPEADALPRAEELGRDLLASIGRLNELIEDLEFTVRGEEPRYVFWADMAGMERDQPELWAAPLEVAPQLAAKLFGARRSCILCSATLTVAGRFDYVVGRLGLDLVGQEPPAEPAPAPGEREMDEDADDDSYPVRHRAPARAKPAPPKTYDTLLLGTPFDFAAQCRALVPAWLSEPGYAETGRNSADLTAMLVELFKATRGRGLVLFTSYAALDEVYRDLRPALEPEGIAVLAQGRDGSRESLLAALQGEEPVVLLGASSFWEGVDVRGPALSCLVLTRLPFQVHTEPLFQARAELVESRGHSSFMDYSLPEAVLKFRQGFGRLIRSKTDRGVAVLADKRLVSKRYGSAFLSSLPCRAKIVASNAQLVREVEGFFGE